MTQPRIEPGKIIEFADFLLLLSSYVPLGQSGPQGNGSTRVPKTSKVLKPIWKKDYKVYLKVVKHWEKDCCDRQSWDRGERQGSKELSALIKWILRFLFYKRLVQFIWSNDSLECRFLPAIPKVWKQTRSWLWITVFKSVVCRVKIVNDR